MIVLLAVYTQTQISRPLRFLFTLNTLSTWRITSDKYSWYHRSSMTVHLAFLHHRRIPVAHFSRMKLGMAGLSRWSNPQSHWEILVEAKGSGSWTLRWIF